LGVDHPVVDLVHRWDIGGQGLQIRLLQQVHLGRAAHGEHALGLCGRAMTAPIAGLAIEVIPIAKAPCGQEIALDVEEGLFDAPLAVAMPQRMGHKGGAEVLGEGLDLRGHHRVGPGACGHEHTGVVDHTARTDPVGKAKRFAEKSLGLEAGKGREVLEEQQPAVGQYERGALGGNGLVADHHPVR
jgi:hypothetical protein